MTCYPMNSNPIPMLHFAWHRHHRRHKPAPLRNVKDRDRVHLQELQGISSFAPLAVDCMEFEESNLMLQQHHQLQVPHH